MTVRRSPLWVWANRRVTSDAQECRRARDLAATVAELLVELGE